MKTDFFFDFETRSRADLTKVGAAKYAADMSTEPMIITWTFGRYGALRCWRMGQPIPQDLLDVMLFPQKYNFIAWNIEFDYFIWITKFLPLFVGTQRPQVEDLIDAMAISNYYRTGGSLEAASISMGMPKGKDKEGKKILTKAMKPNAKTQMFDVLTPDEWAKLERYAIQDTRLLRDIYYKYPTIPHSEMWLWRWTFKQNITGIRYDVPLVAELNSLIDENLPPLEHEFASITGGLKIKSQKCLEFFKPYFPWIENMKKGTVRDMMLEIDKVPAHIARAVTIKFEAGSTSIAKASVLIRMGLWGRIFSTLEYGKAQTLRWAGRGVQIHNFPRVNDKLKDQLDFDLNIADLASYIRYVKRPNLLDPIGFVKNLLRRVWIPDPGQVFYSGDYAKMEPTVLYWLLGLGPIPPKWYEEMASAIYGIPVEQVGKESRERELGKEAQLGGGYGMGAAKFRQNLFEKTGILITMEEAKRIVNTYRNSNPAVVKFWSEAENAFTRAINGETVALCGGKVHVMPMTSPIRGVQIRLPSGIYLHYPLAGVRETSKIQEIVGYVNGVPTIIDRRKVYKNELTYVEFTEQGHKIKTVYGGKLVENIVSAIARCIIGPAIYEMERVGFHVLASVHDEIMAQSGPGREREFEEAMCIRPYWAKDMDIRAEVKSGVRYLK